MSTHRVFVEHDTTGDVKMMFKGSLGECLGYQNEWLNHQKLLHEPGDDTKYLSPGWSMYIAEIQQETIILGKERRYRVLGEPAVDPANERELDESEARRAIMAIIHFDHPLAKVWKNVYGDNTPTAVRHARQQALSVWRENAGTISVMDVIESLVKEETDEPQANPEEG